MTTQHEPTASITPDLPNWPTNQPRQTFYLSVIESTGPFEDDLGNEDGQECPQCHKRPQQGQQIVRFGHQWWHLPCAAHHMRSGGAAAAWLALAADLAARPSAYSVTETRAIVRQLLAITQLTDAPLCPSCGLDRTYAEMTTPTTEETAR